MEGGEGGKGQEVEIEGRNKVGEPLGSLEGREDGSLPLLKFSLLELIFFCRKTSAQKEEEVLQAGLPAKLTPYAFSAVFLSLDPTDCSPGLRRSSWIVV